jgi:hypothetical protein
MEAGGKVAANLAQVGMAVKICDEFMKRMDGYQKEIKDLYL